MGACTKLLMYVASRITHIATGYPNPRASISGTEVDDRQFSQLDVPIYRPAAYIEHLRDSRN